MNKVICTTTINPPTEALRKFALMQDWTLVVAGDKKTPCDSYNQLNCLYLTPEIQERYDKELSDLIGWNCIQRRNFALLWACKELKADIIATVDDDNIPLRNWGKEIIAGTRTVMEVYDCEANCFNPLAVTNHPQLWHRGFPLELVRRRNIKSNSQQKVRVDVQADLWNGDPDIDAICRMMNPEKVSLDCRFPYSSVQPSPFNSQNTFLSREVMPHYFMFPGIGRLDDIWASYHVQAQGYKVAYCAPSVVQERNEHSVIADMKAEYIGYENNLRIVQAIESDKNGVLAFLPENSLKAFIRYQKHFE